MEPIREEEVQEGTQWWIVVQDKRFRFRITTISKGVAWILVDADKGESKQTIYIPGIYKSIFRTEEDALKQQIINTEEKVISEAAKLQFFLKQLGEASETAKKDFVERRVEFWHGEYAKLDQ